MEGSEVIVDEVADADPEGLNNIIVFDDVGSNVECDSEKSSRKVRAYTCLMCGKKFLQASGRYNHMKKVHNIYPGDGKPKVKCLEQDCNYSCAYKEQLQLHLTSEHNIKMDVSIKNFENMHEFLVWKDEFERLERSRFVKKSGSRQRDVGVRIGYYYCSRSGNYVSHSKGIKRTKKIGTAKANSYCTASITCFELPDGKIEVKVCSTHYGHDNNLQHLRLTQSQKCMIAEQLVQGVPRELVLDNVRASVGSDVDKLHLISLKDVKNIEKSFGIKGVANIKTDNVYHNLIFWVSNIMKSDNSPLIFFNESGDFESKNHKDHDLTLVLLTKGQTELLEKFGSNAVYYVSPFIAENTHSTINTTNYYFKAYSVYVTVILLVDHLNDVVPVGYMISHKLEPNKYVNMFDSIKDKVPSMSAKVVLTDDREEIFDAWCSVFDDNPVHLWSNRFVDSDWRLNLIQIPDEDVQVSIYEQLYSYLESEDKSKLESTLEPFVVQLQLNESTNKFGDYFVSKYIGCENLWAGCYGKALVGVNAQLNMEKVFDQIEETVQRKNWDRNFLVRLVQQLIKYINEKQCDRHDKLQKQIQELPIHHKYGMNVKPEAVIKQSNLKWRVNSVKDPENIYSIVSKTKLKCSGGCTMFCTECDSCNHQFECSCMVYQFDKTMCKHIHAVAYQLKPTNSNYKTKAKQNTEELTKQTTLWEEKHFKKSLETSVKGVGRKNRRRKCRSINSLDDVEILEEDIKTEVESDDESPENNSMAIDAQDSLSSSNILTEISLVEAQADSDSVIEVISIQNKITAENTSSVEHSTPSTSKDPTNSEINSINNEDASCKNSESDLTTIEEPGVGKNQSTSVDKSYVSAKLKRNFKGYSRKIFQKTATTEYTPLDKIKPVGINSANNKSQCDKSVESSNGEPPAEGNPLDDHLYSHVSTSKSEMPKNVKVGKPGKRSTKRTLAEELDPENKADTSKSEDQDVRTTFSGRVYKKRKSYRSRISENESNMSTANEKNSSTDMKTSEGTLKKPDLPKDTSSENTSLPTSTATNVIVDQTKSTVNKRKRGRPRKETKQPTAEVVKPKDAQLEVKTDSVCQTNDSSTENVLKEKDSSEKPANE